MFEFAHSQANGLQQLASSQGPGLVPVACTQQPARAYELLCALAADLAALGHCPVILDASAHEVQERQDNDGSHLGLLHVLQNADVAGLARAPEGAEWLAMPSARGLQALQLTARAGGPALALSRLLAPFGTEALVILYAPAMHLASLLAGLNAHALVPVLPTAQASFEAYASLKLLHGAGLTPVLAPLEQDADHTEVALAQVVQSVSDCALRHLDHGVAIWQAEHWAELAHACALIAPQGGSAQSVQAWAVETPWATAAATPSWS